MPDTLLDHLHASRTILCDEITWCEQREHELRGELDQVVEQRGQKADALRALDTLISNHFAPDEDATSAIPAAAVARDRAAAARDRAAQRVTCTDCGKEFSALGIGSHRANAHAATAAAPPPVHLPPAPAPAPAPSPAIEKKTGRPRTLDYAEAAQVVIGAQAAGQLPVPALMKHYGKSESFAKNLLRRLRLAGELPTSPNANIRVLEDVVDPDDPSPPTIVVQMPPLPEVAETYREAIGASRRPIQTIVDRYDCTRDQAQEWVDLARCAGELPPKGQPVLDGTEAPHQFVPRS